nr:transcriptional regulator, LuxR family protein [Rhodococcus sp. JVH1]
MSVHDYRRSATITYHYDRPVLTEGLRSVLAVPVVVGRKARAVLYAANRECAPIGARTANLVVTASRRLGTEILVRDEVDRRLQMLATIEPAGADGATTEELRDIHAALRAVQHIADTTVRSRLHGVVRADRNPAPAEQRQRHEAGPRRAPGNPRDRRSLARRAWLHQQQNRPKTFRGTRNREELSARCDEQARGPLTSGSTCHCTQAQATAMQQPLLSSGRNLPGAGR